jgi:Spy/CpxP family protein refolding chaperone
MMPFVSRRLLAAGVLLTLAPLALAAASQQGPPRRWWKAESIVKDLALTPDQSARIDTIFEAAFPELRQEREELERREAKLSRLLRDPKVDEATLAREIDRVETARASGNKTRSLMLMRMYRVLTPEQRVRFDELSKQWNAPTTAKPGLPQSGRPSDSQRRPR